MLKHSIVALVLFAGCKNSNYCAGNPDNNCNEHASDAQKQIDGMEPLDCTVAGCGDSGKVCDSTTKACVECTVTESAACSATSPVCKNDACTACEASIDCPSQACLGTGACEDASMVAYAKAGGTGDCLTPATACGTVLAALGTGRPVIRVSGTLSENVAINTGTITLIGDDDGSTKIGSAIGGSTLLTVSGASTNVTVHNITFVGVTANAYGITLLTDLSHPPSLELDEVTVTGTGGTGIATTGGTLVVDRANIAHNAVYGISLSSTTFHMKNVFVTENGTINVPTGGGITLAGGGGTLEFATIVNNLGSNDGTSRGLACSGTVTVDSSLLQTNIGPQFGGSGCTFQYSNFFPDTPPTGTGNVHVQVTFAGSSDYHLAANSPMKDIANPTSTVGDDVDGNSRPQGAVRDIGADELMP